MQQARRPQRRRKQQQSQQPLQDFQPEEHLFQEAQKQWGVAELEEQFGQERAQTPALRRESVTSEDERPELASPKMAMACPQPRRIFAPNSTSPSAENPPGSPWSTQDEACNELRELLGTTKETGLLFDSAFDARPLSSVSTAAGLTPSPDERAFTPAHERAETPQSPILEHYDDEWGDYTAEVAPQTVRPRGDGEGAREKPGLPAQIRKVFVGGIPQNMNQDDLYTIFSNFAGVKKAWLQVHRVAGAALSSPPRNHRGFGFVIFHDGNAVEKLLGQSASRFIALPDGRKLEVKRAVSSNDMAAPSGGGPAPPPRAGDRSRGKGGSSQLAPQSPPSPAPDHRWQGVQAPWAGAIPMPPPLPPVAPVPLVPAMSSMQAQPQAPAALAPWPTAGSGSVPTLMQAQPGYSGMAGVYVAGATGPNVLVQPRADVAQMVQGAGPQIVLAPGPAVCEQVNGALIQKQTWVVDPSSQAAMQIALGQAHVPQPALPPLMSPQPVLASWAHNPMGGAVPPQWAHLSAASSGALPSQPQGPPCAVQWVHSQADPRAAACHHSPALPDADVSPALPDAACSGGRAAPVVLPNSLVAPEPQQPAHRNNKELESALLQAMPDYYDD